MDAALIITGTIILLVFILLMFGAKVFAWCNTYLIKTNGCYVSPHGKLIWLDQEGKNVRKKTKNK